MAAEGIPDVLEAARALRNQQAAVPDTDQIAATRPFSPDIGLAQRCEILSHAERAPGRALSRPGRMETGRRAKLSLRGKAGWGHAGGRAEHRLQRRRRTIIDGPRHLSGVAVSRQQMPGQVFPGQVISRRDPRDPRRQRLVGQQRRHERQPSHRALNSGCAPAPPGAAAGAWHPRPAARARCPHRPERPGRCAPVRFGSPWRRPAPGHGRSTA